MPAKHGVLTAEAMIAALEDLNAALASENRRATLGLCGGAVMTLVYQARKSTEDIDAWIDDPATVKRAAGAIAQQRGLPEQWLNDAVREFLPSDPNRFMPWRSLSHLTVLVARPQVMLAMKLHASRLKDLPDIELLLQETGTTFDQALTLYRTYYGAELDPERRALLRDALGGGT